MPTVINTNLASLFAQNSLTNAQNNLAQSVQRLSSGLRINSAKDDAAGLAIAQLMQSNINGVNQSIRNLTDATNVLQVADTALSTIQDMLLRMKQLSVQGYDGLLSTAQMVNVRTEITELRDEINATAKRTSFNNVNLLSGNRAVDASVSDVAKGELLITSAISDVTDGDGDLSAGQIGFAGVGTVVNIDFGDSSTADVTWINSATSNSDLYQNLPGSYVLTSALGSGLLTLNKMDDNGDWIDSQTLVVGNIPGSNSGDTEETISLNFDKFGLQLNLAATIAVGETGLGTAIADQLDSKTIEIVGQSARITDLQIGDARSGSYRFTNVGADLKLTHSYLDAFGTAQTDEQILTLRDDYFGAGMTSTINFDRLGIRLELYNFQANDATDIASAISGLENLTDPEGAAQTGNLLITVGNGTRSLGFQSGANSSSFITVNTLEVNTESAASDSTIKALGGAVKALENLTSSSDVESWQAAYQSMDSAVDNAIVYLSQERAIFGAQMNRVGYISTNLTAQSTNLQASRSSIIDTDFASETAKLTKGQIMQQAATAMLAQANQMPNVVLSLLK
jgi:flagellin